MLAHAEIVVGAPHRDLARALRRDVNGDGKRPAAALKVGEHTVAAFPMQGLQPLPDQALNGHGSVSCCIRFQAELARRGTNLARCRRVVLEDIERLAVGGDGGLPLAQHDARAHQARPAFGVAGRSLQASRQAVDHRPDGGVTLDGRRRVGLCQFRAVRILAALRGGLGMAAAGGFRLCVLMQALELG